MKVVPWELLSEKPEQVGRRRLLRRVFRLPDGREAEYCVKNDINPVCILPITRELRVVLVRQYRPGPHKVLTELPGGGIEPGEEPLAAAARELREETGYVGRLTFVGTSLMCAYSTGLRHNFVATGCERVSDPEPDANEFLEVVTMSVEEFQKHLRTGQLTDLTTGYMGLDYLGWL